MVLKIRNPMMLGEQELSQKVKLGGRFLCAAQNEIRDLVQPLVLHLKEWRFREGKRLAQSHTAIARGTRIKIWSLYHDLEYFPLPILSS